MMHSVRQWSRIWRSLSATLGLVCLAIAALFLLGTPIATAQSVVPAELSPAHGVAAQGQTQRNLPPSVTQLLYGIAVKNPSGVQFPQACMHECTADCPASSASEKHECFRICADLCREAMFTDEMARELARRLRGQQ